MSTTIDLADLHKKARAIMVEHGLGGESLLVRLDTWDHNARGPETTITLTLVVDTDKVSTVYDAPDPEEALWRFARVVRDRARGPQPMRDVAEALIP
jgi:hypothetical protein